MTLRRQFVLVFVAFSAVVSLAMGWAGRRIAEDALEAELDERLSWVAGAAAETGLQSSLVLALQPGDESSVAWRTVHERLRRLRRYVRAAYIVDGSNRALVTSAPADSFPIGTPLRVLEPYREELAQARLTGNATTPAFEAADGEWYKYGFAQLEQSEATLAVLMPADYLAPLAGLRRTILVGSILGAVAAAALAALLAGGVVVPLERLSRVALRIQRGQMDRPVGEEPGVELGRLSRAMERMRVAIVERDERLRLMLAQVAHEIRNPLGGLELFAAEAGETDDPVERRRLIGRVRSEVKALNRIIDDFLAFARPPAAVPEVVDLRGPLREAAELAEAELARRGGRLGVDLPGEPLSARVDPDQAKRAVLNLLRNAAQAGTRVLLHGRSVQGPGGGVLVRVADDGPGVAPELRERIFEPFVSDKERGAGLGLAIVRGLVEANGGQVEVSATTEPDFGTGAEFRLYFPGPAAGDGSSPSTVADREGTPVPGTARAEVTG